MGRPAAGHVRQVLHLPPGMKRELAIEAATRDMTVSAVVLELHLAFDQDLKRGLVAEAARRGVTIRQLVTEAFASRTTVTKH